MEEILEIVDGKNRVTCTGRRSVIHEKGLKHRSSVLFIFNGKNEMLLGKRAKGKDMFPGRWSFPVAGHLKPGESPEASVCRECKEELGVETNAEYVTLLPPSKENGNHFLYVYKATTGKRLSGFRFNREEFSSLKFLSMKDLKKSISENEGRFSPAFIEAFRELDRKKII